MQYAYLKNLITTVQDESGNEVVALPSGLFQRLLASALGSKNLFDEAFYVSYYPDVQKAILDKVVSSGAAHYFATGYFENRLPRRLLVDERFYIEQNPDVAQAIKKAVVKNAQEHFEYSGFKEGRAPFKDFSLF